MVHFNFPTTNNVTKYEAFLAGKRIADVIDAAKVKIYTDSQLVACQIKGEFTPKEENIAQYKVAAMNALQAFQTWEVIQVNRGRDTDALAHPEPHHP